MWDARFDPMPVYGTTVKITKRSEGAVPGTVFDAFLYRPFDRLGQLKLTIALRIKLRQLPVAPHMSQLDSDSLAFPTLPWSDADWQQFLQGANNQADMWNNKFWLIPPPTFSDFDVAFHGSNKVRRPNIRCELVVDFKAAADVHKAIDVANLNRALLAPGADAGTFRSEALLYDSLDTVPWVFPWGQGPNLPQRHPVIAHEIGHAIGLGHIGVLLKTPLCEVAIAVDAGARNSDPCYGRHQGAIAGNIMGVGDTFTVENARPWVWAIGSMRKDRKDGEAAQWKVVMRDPGPSSWVTP